MNIKSTKFILFSIITFVIIFLMNYIGSAYPDKLSRAFFTAFAAVVGLAIGMWYLGRNKNNDQEPDFD